MRRSEARAQNPIPEKGRNAGVCPFNDLIAAVDYRPDGERLRSNI
jgi:hypothetical protein